MNRRLLALCGSIACLAGACATSSPLVPASPSSAPSASVSPPDPGVSADPSASTEPAFAMGPIERFSKDRAMRHVRKLAGAIGVRVRATPAERAGMVYAAERLREYGYRVNVQEFPVDGRRSRNVVAWWPGAKRYPFVIGAHMDTVPGSPGANDNASGVAVMLEVARLIAGKAQARWVRFVAFGAEEYGADGSHHVGSQVFVSRLGAEGRSRLAGMLSVDMVADGRPLAIGHSGISHDGVARRVHRVVTDTGIATRWRVLCDCSDHGPFERAGIPAGFMWSGEEPNYHDHTDTVPNMRPSDLYRTGRALRAFVKVLDRNVIHRFKRF